MRLPRFRLRTLMISIAYLALLMTVFMQYVHFQRAAAQEERYRAEAERNRALAAASAQRARAQAEHAQAAVDRILKQIEK